MIGLCRAMADELQLEGIRINVICPGVVKTNLLKSGGWDGFAQESLTSMNRVVQTVLHLVNGENDLTTADQVKVPADCLYGLAVEISLDNIYVRAPPRHCDEAMKRVMEATSPKIQSGRITEV